MRKLIPLTLIALFLLAATASARAATLTLNPTSGPVGTNVQANGLKYPKNTAGSLTFGTSQVATFTTGSSGAIPSVHFNVPAGYSGNTTVRATVGGTSATAAFNVTGVPPPGQCNDGVNNDGDAWTDYPADPGCSSATDTTESPNPQCSDGVDNADPEDTLVDYPNDPGCTGITDNDETDAPPPPPPGGCPIGFTWCDDFSGPAGTPPNSATWLNAPWACENDSQAAQFCNNPANARTDGSGNMVLKVTAPGTQGRPYDGIRITTWNRCCGYPPPSFTVATRPHTWVQARIKYGGDPGVWSALWPESVDPSYVELDMTEVRLGHPTEAGVHVHGPANWDGACTVASIKDWHVYGMDYFSDHVTFYTDDQVCGQYFFPAGFTAPRVGLQLENKVGNPGSWGGDGGPPSAPGAAYEADMFVDYVAFKEY